MTNRTKERAASKPAKAAEDMDLDFSLSQESNEVDGLQEKACVQNLAPLVTCIGGGRVLILDPTGTDFERP